MRPRQEVHFIAEDEEVIIVPNFSLPQVCVFSFPVLLLLEKRSKCHDWISNIAVDALSTPSCALQVHLLGGTVSLQGVFNR